MTAAAAFSTMDVVRASGLSYRRVDYSVRCGYLWPDHAEPGTGCNRSWPASEVEIACRIGRLTAAGLPLAVAARFARDDWPSGELAGGIQVVVFA